MSALTLAIQDFQALLTSAREREQRCGAVIAQALSTPPVDPDDDTLDAAESDYPPPPHYHEKGP